ncbi:RNase adapter RapZ [Candidatus Methylospira mobilis]|uniref:RNase adapter RapZ n=1 Tax=Candidatus Methylospira mobilis TaxID=1808979 RepID=A0A5Q0BMJ1_9GAMM|nr:RNase adapter RapZ [Candidatus Methylospira mobilis]QFY43317.1 RNase adapter RapZ [Candidatus Methylospira mobilis]WNV03474.1 RNase adapter RapZ [Candidatus Methylospira mobilis]
MKLIIVSGLSGSGKSIALETLEDCGYYCIDNLPIALLNGFISEAMITNRVTFQKTAIGIDARNPGESLEHFPSTRAMMQDHGIDCSVIFLQAAPSTLLKRFSETRRKHPLTDAAHSLPEAIEWERGVLEPISREADLVIDTTYTHVHQLRELIFERVGMRNEHLMSLCFQSFGFKNGLPLDTDFLFDARCLPNPHWEPNLRSKTGKDREVNDFLSAIPEVMNFLGDINAFMERWLPRFEAERRSYLNISVGCTGGQHRSVFLIEALARHFQSSSYDILVRHRDLS